MLNEYTYCNVISFPFVKEILEPSSGQGNYSNEFLFKVKFYHFSKLNDRYRVYRGNVMLEKGLENRKVLTLEKELY